MIEMCKIYFYKAPCFCADFQCTEANKNEGIKTILIDSNVLSPETTTLLSHSFNHNKNNLQGIDKSKIKEKL